MMPTVRGDLRSANWPGQETGPQRVELITTKETKDTRKMQFGGLLFSCLSWFLFFLGEHVVKAIIATLCLALFAGAALGQDRIAPEQAQRFAKLFADKTKTLDDLPVKVDVNPDQGTGIHHDRVGALVIPEKSLTKDSLGSLGQKPAPVGQLWMRNLSPIASGKAIANNDLRLIMVSINNEDHSLPMFLLAVQKKGDGAELLVFAKDKKPVLTLPLEKIDLQQELPLDLEGKKGENDTGILLLNLFGKYQAKIPIAQQEQ